MQTPVTDHATPAHSLERVITRLAAANSDGDKELEIYQEALSAALDALKDRPSAQASIARAIKAALGSDVDDIAYQDHEHEISALNAYCALS